MSQKTVAIVEDDLPIAQMYRIKLELAGYNVVVAEDGRSGLAMLAKTHPDLLLLDVMMPYMDGDEVLKTLRAEPAFANLPVIILTNVGSEELQHKIERFGVTAYIQKSDLTPRQVLARVDEVLGRDNPDNDSKSSNDLADNDAGFAAEK